MKSKYLVFILIVICSNLVVAQTFPLFNHPVVNNGLTKPGWTCVFNDEFNSGPSSLLWESVRATENFHPVQYSFDQCNVESGRLILKCEKELSFVNNSFHNIITGETWSKDLGLAVYRTSSQTSKFKYGYVEIRAKLARGNGMHSSFWLYGRSSDDSAFEIDIFEADHFGRPPVIENDFYPWAKPEMGNIMNQPIQTFNTNFHKTIDVVQTENGESFALPHLNSNNFSETYNTYAVMWTPYDITWYLNNKEIRSIDAATFYNLTGMYPSEICDLRIILSLDYDNRLDESSPDEAMMEVEYVRLYQKDVLNYIAMPNIFNSLNDEVVIGTESVCNAPSYTFYTNSPHAKQWSVDSENGVIIGSSTGSSVNVSFQPNKRAMTLTLKITTKDGKVSERNITITNRLDSYFFFDELLCENNTLKLSVSANSPSSSSLWNLYACDANGNATSSLLQQGTGNSYTFTNLSPDTYYLVKHGVWNSLCNDWSESQRMYRTNFLRSFDNNVVNATASSYDVQVSIHENTANVNHLTQLYYCDNAGNITSSALQQINGINVVFSGLLYNQHYLIKHGVWTSCNSWQESRRVIYLENSSGLLRNYNVSEQIGIINNLEIYPNPTTGFVHIEMENIKAVNVCSIDGKLSESYGQCKKIDLSYFPNGIYLISVETDEDRYVRKIIKM